MTFDLDPSFERQLLTAIEQSIAVSLVPIIQAETRVDTGELRDSTQVSFIDNRLILSQGGSIESDHAIWIELKYGDFSRTVNSLDWEFRS